MAKVFSIEDGNLNTKSIRSSLTKTYKDIDMSFERKPSGDIYKKEDAAAVKQAVKNLLLTNNTEKPFNPLFGGDLNRFLFELSEDYDEIELREQIYSAITNFEPRALVREINTQLNPDANNVSVRVVFQLINTPDVLEIDFSIARLR